MMEWRRSRAAADDSVLREIERRRSVVLPRDYQETVLSHSGGVPARQLFMVRGTERVFSRLISAEADRHPNLLDALEWTDDIPGRKVIPFATDPFGNLLCFSYMTPTVFTVTYLDMESGASTPITASFTSFLEGLRAPQGGAGR